MLIVFIIVFAFRYQQSSYPTEQEETVSTFTEESEATYIDSEMIAEPVYEAENHHEPQVVTPESQYKDNLQGTYLATENATMGDPEMTRQYGKFVISGDRIASYQWDTERNGWIQEYNVPYILETSSGSDYMSGAILVFHAEGMTQRMNSGDLDRDGRMDIWMSDSMYHTKQ